MRLTLGDMIVISSLSVLVPFIGNIMLAVLSNSITFVTHQLHMAEQDFSM